MEKLSFDLPPGYRFSPTDKELIEDFLKPKITGNDKDICFVPEIEFYEHEPWDLQHKSGIDSKDQEWFFFNTPSWKHGSKKNRATKKGCWKSTGQDTKISSREVLIGMKKILVYRSKRTPNEEGTKWVMHEYRTTQEEFDGNHPGQKAFVLCRLFKKEEERKKGGFAKSDFTDNGSRGGLDANAQVDQDLDMTEAALKTGYIHLQGPYCNSLSPSTDYYWGQFLMSWPGPTVSENSDLGHNNGSCGGSDANAQLDRIYNYS